MTKENLQQEIQLLGLEAIKDFFKADINKIDKETIDLIHKKAKLGMSFEREINLSKRAIELNYIRVFKMVAEDKKELKSLIKKSLPKYLN